MNANLQAIADYLAKRQDMAALQPWQVAEQLNAPDPANTYRGDTEVSAARGVLLASGAWAKIVLAADNAATPLELRAVCITVRDTLSPPMVTVYTSDPQILAVIEASLGALVTAELVTEEVKDALLALSVKSQSWSQANLGAPVSARDIVLAKGGN